VRRVGTSPDQFRSANSIEEIMTQKFDFVPNDFGMSAITDTMKESFFVIRWPREQFCDGEVNSVLEQHHDTPTKQEICTFSELSTSKFTTKLSEYRHWFEILRGREAKCTHFL